MGLTLTQQDRDILNKAMDAHENNPKRHFCVAIAVASDRDVNSNYATKRLPKVLGVSDIWRVFSWWDSKKKYSEDGGVDTSEAVAAVRAIANG